MRSTVVEAVMVTELSPVELKRLKKGVFVDDGQ
jgi:hypothetical protein